IVTPRRIGILPVSISACQSPGLGVCLGNKRNLNMDQAKAVALINQQRRWWRRQDPDLAIARRAERVFFRIAVVYLIFAPIFFGIASLPKHHRFYVVA